MICSVLPLASRMVMHYWTRLLARSQPCFSVVAGRPTTLLVTLLIWCIATRELHWTLLFYYLNFPIWMSTPSPKQEKALSLKRSVCNRPPWTILSIEALPFMVLKVESSGIRLILRSFYSTLQTSGSALLGEYRMLKKKSYHDSLN